MNFPSKLSPGDSPSPTRFPTILSGWRLGNIKHIFATRLKQNLIRMYWKSFIEWKTNCGTISSDMNINYKFDQRSQERFQFYGWKNDQLFIICSGILPTIWLNSYSLTEKEAFEYIHHSYIYTDSTKYRINGEVLLYQDSVQIIGN